MSRKLVEGTSASNIFLNSLEYVMADFKNQKLKAYPPMTYNMGNTNGEDIGKVYQEFIANYEYSRKRRGQVVLYHEVMSFHANDTSNITPQVYKYLTLQYFRMRGSQAKCFCGAHLDVEHFHAHILVSGNKLFSKYQNRLTKNSFLHIQQELQRIQFEKFPQITHSFVEFKRSSEHGLSKTQTERNRKLDIEIQLKRRGQQTVKEMLKEFVLKGLNEEIDKDGLIEYLDKQNIIWSEKKGKVRSVKYKGRTYRMSTLGVEQEIKEFVQSEQKGVDFVEGILDYEGISKDLEKDQDFDLEM